MTKFENIVRPFQLPSVTYPTRVFDPTQKEADDIDKFFGEEGQAATFSLSFNQEITTYKDEKVKETNRETHKKRIENPDDASQFVDVELIDKLSTKKGTGSKYQKTEYKFEND